MSTVTGRALVQHDQPRRRSQTKPLSNVRSWNLKVSLSLMRRRGDVMADEVGRLQMADWGRSKCPVLKVVVEVHMAQEDGRPPNRGDIRPTRRRPDPKRVRDYRMTTGSY
ncbi:hypothetical protein NDN08_005171 [Rhodosorus marinus]|uniref:Uncharacterized protein n=1 Tax=Rhodosorus marinus TaxID=101924 RepID=A0AAV8V3U1_9RHOD|nr:hypothetical protein NDN08_005171 [Rhodosorus marinus]